MMNDRARDIRRGRFCRAELALTILWGVSLARAVDFSPIQATYELDGVKLPILNFRDGQKIIEYAPPHGWRATGSEASLTLVPNTHAQADGKVEVTSPPLLVGFEPENVPKYVERVKQSLPREALKVTILEATSDPLHISGKSTLGVGVTYELYGAPFRGHYFFLLRERELWTFRFTARTSDFEKVFEPFRQSLYSITGL